MSLRVGKCPYCKAKDIIDLYVTSEEGSEEGYFDSIYIYQCKTCKLIFNEDTLKEVK